MTKEVLNIGKMTVTAFAGYKGDASVLISIDNKQEKLTSRQALTLAHALLSRVVGAEGYNATD